ncbi:hypothetical protein [Alkalicoccus chagannorensis]|uniref:hypothetical protein n=1 Tax=Alkalicoccus chagannorensis TaxID=427072 RepID=UPI0012EB70D9|nr:hypothetical protein [Alkalicoccus chagannorensis]
MAKQQNNSKKNTEKKQSRVLVFLMVVIVPVLFALVLAVVMLYYLGFNVGDTARDMLQSLPFVESDEDEEIPEEEYVARLEHENESFEQRIAELETALADTEEELEEAQEELFALQNDELDEEEDAEQATADFDDVVRTLQEMTASSAAEIIEELPEAQAVLYLRAMNVNARAEIISRIEPDLAASILNQISDD